VNSERIGRYQIIRKIGQGGMAEVYLASDPRFKKRRVAIKVLPHRFTSHSRLRERFQREAEIIATLEHPAIVPIHDIGEHEEQPFIVMRYMLGGALDRRMQSGPLLLAAAMRIIQRIASAMDEAHLQGIVHRDLKPGNILFDHRGNAYICDFGIAKLSEASHDLTGMGLMGTPPYMSPEQFKAPKSVDGRSDIYSMGVMLFEMLTNEPLFPHATGQFAALAYAHVNTPPPKICSINPNLPAEIEPLIQKILAKKPNTRFPTAGAFVQELRPIVKRVEIARLVDTAEEALVGMRWDEVEQQIEELQNWDTDGHQTAQDLQIRLEHQKISTEVARLSEAITETIAKKNWSQAQKYIDKTKTLGDEGREVAQKLQQELDQTRTDTEILNLSKAIQTALVEEDWQTIQEHIDALQKLGSAGKQVSDEAQAQLEQAVANQAAEIENLVAEAENALGDQNWDKVQQIIVQLQKRGIPGESAAVSLQERFTQAKVQAKREAEIERLVAAEATSAEKQIKRDELALKAMVPQAKENREKTTHLNSEKRTHSTVGGVVFQDLDNETQGRSQRESNDVTKKSQAELLDHPTQKQLPYLLLTILLIGIPVGVVVVRWITPWVIDSFVTTLPVVAEVTAAPSQPPALTKTPFMATNIPTPPSIPPPTTEVVVLDFTLESNETETPTSTPTFTATPTDTSQPTPNFQTGILSQAARVRGGPGIEFNTITFLSPGTEVEIEGRSSSGTWLVITLPESRQGWITSRAVDVDVEIESLEIISSPPTPTTAPLIPTKTPKPKDEATPTHTIAPP